jgi:predicted dehydrogenase
MTRMSDRVRVGLIGCGAISAAYLSMAKNFSSVIEIAACADLNMDGARAKAREFDIPRAASVEEVLADRSIQIILNLTIPKAHAPVALAAIEAGKHSYAEKPLGITRDEGVTIMRAADRANLRVGCAPDTFLGAGIQTARKLIDDGAIGRPVAFTAFMLSPGVEGWHPNPPFYYEPGGGPMLDMGPYYLTALLNLLGPAKRISGAASIAIPERTITHRTKDGSPGPMFGRKVTVTTPDHVAGTIEFTGGAVGTIMTSFATRFGNYDGKQPITIYGTEGTLKVPDPNHFDGVASIRGKEDSEWRDVPHEFVTGYGRSVGLADMAAALRTGRAHRATGQQALAVLDLMQGFLESSASGRAYEPAVPYERPAPMNPNLSFGMLD